ncbi:cytochrome b [Kozakia baliensis]|uniref:Cytochrome b n=1 Tax=Kozakia baliensis TaxID=153496 RepID=A0A1D8UR57_9PROT|nr:cytochrome b N-terminal domain-containing protein [Kozakia baliensis]AOX16142.1 ubiquinol-cytochrome C reductase [Kozakia baliensis]GBR23366.1 ubiquinol-cytochrome c reductase cytochrome b subunit [Kozakia baliensis NRIC 0488]GEL65027.1 cytochrome b [Kozakia baliensis]
MTDRPDSASNWLEARLPIISAFRREYVDFAMPRNLNYLWNFGAFATVAMALLIVSGVFLAINYTPTVAAAFSSIETIDRQVASGWLIRAIHMGGVSMLFAALYVHLARGLYYGSYKAPRELLWLTGLGLLLMVMTAAFAGYILPWGQMSYWGATVVINALNAVPLIGRPLASLLLGGDGLGDVALHRIYVLHFVTAFSILGVIGLHLAALHVTGSNNPAGVEPRKADDTVPFHPYYTSKDGLGLCLFLAVYAVLIFFLPGWLTLADNYVQANPLITPRDITPEWYFAPFYAILRAVPSKLGGLVLAVGSIGVLFAVPWLDRSPVRSARYRPLLRLALPVLFLSFILLGFAGMRRPTPEWLWLSRAAMVYWYVFFLVLLPILPKIEKTKPLPESLWEAGR